MSYDINVLVLNQTCPVHLPFPTPAIVLRNEREDPVSASRYCGYWPFLMKLPGMHYSILSADNEFLGAYALCDSDFAAPPAEQKPDWIPMETWESLTSFIVADGVYADFRNVISFLLATSPEGFIMFQTRYQSTEPYTNDVVYGVVTLPVFFQMLEQKQIRFNTCYIISNWFSGPAAAVAQTEKTALPEDPAQKMICQIESRFDAEAIRLNNSRVYFHQTAEQIVRECERRDMKIRAIQAILLHGYGIDLAESKYYDYSEDSAAVSREKARTVLRELENTDCLYELEL